MCVNVNNQLVHLYMYTDRESLGLAFLASRRVSLAGGKEFTARQGFVPLGVQSDRCPQICWMSSDWKRRKPVTKSIM